MGERAKIILNEYSAKSLLMRDTLDLDKFYTADLKLFVEVARKEIKRLNNIINELEKNIDDKLKEFEDSKDYLIDGTTLKDLKNELQELKGSNSNEKL